MKPIISWQQFSRWLMVRCLVSQNSVPYKSAPCAKWLLLSVSFGYFTHKLISAGNKEKYLFFFFFCEADGIFSEIAHSCWGQVRLCQVHPMMSCFSLFVLHCFLSILSAIKRKEKSPKLNRENLFSFFACGVREWAHHWEGTAADTAFIRRAFLGKRMTIRDTNFLISRQVRMVRSLWHCNSRLQPRPVCCHFRIYASHSQKMK